MYRGRCTQQEPHPLLSYLYEHWFCEARQLSFSLNNDDDEYSYENQGAVTFCLESPPQSMQFTNSKAVLSPCDLNYIQLQSCHKVPELPIPTLPTRPQCLASGGSTVHRNRRLSNLASLTKTMMTFTVTRSTRSD